MKTHIESEISAEKKLEIMASFLNGSAAMAQAAVDLININGSNDQLNSIIEKAAFVMSESEAIIKKYML